MNPSDVAAAFIALASERSDKGQLRLSELPVRVPAGAVLAAVDSARRRHLLVPVSSGSPVRIDRRSRGLSITRTELVVAGARSPFVDVACEQEEFDDLFERLTVEMLERIAAAPENAVIACFSTVARWRELLDRQRSKLGAAALVGLWGELWHLRRILELDPARRLDCWAGPLGAKHDFHRAGLALEVKTSARREGRFVEVHGLEQLDREPDSTLLLAWTRVEESHGGQDISSLAADIAAMGGDIGMLNERLDAAGWAPGEPEEPQRIIEHLLYEVDDAFPRIVPASFNGGAPPQGVLRVAYELDLTGASPAALPADVADAQLTRLAVAP